MALVALLGLGLMVLGVLLAARPVGDQQERRRLTRYEDGTVTFVRALDEVYTRLTVEWRDAEGRQHHSDFDTDTYPWSLGEDFAVRYDPHDVRRVRPADEEYTNNGPLRATAVAQGASLAALGAAALLLPLVRPRRARTFGCDPGVTWPASVATPAAHGECTFTWGLYGRTARRLLLGAAGCATAAGIVIPLVLHSDAELLHHGTRTTGVVEGGHVGGRHTQSYVEVRYTDASGRRHDGSLHGPSPDDLPRGTQVTVVYDRAHPARFRTLAYANNSDLADNATLVLPMAAVGLAFAGGATQRRWRQGQQLLRAGHWTEIDVIAFRSYARRSSALLSVPVDGQDEPVVLRFTGARQGLPDLSLAYRHTKAFLLTSPARPQVLLHAAGMQRPHLGILPRTRRQRQRWLERLQGGTNLGLPSSMSGRR